MKTLINECYQSHLLWKYMVNVHLILLHTLIFEYMVNHLRNLQNIEFPPSLDLTRTRPPSMQPQHRIPPPQTRCRVLHPKTVPSPGGAEYSCILILVATVKNGWLLKWPKNRIYENSIIARGTLSSNISKFWPWMLYWIIIWVMNYPYM